MPKAEGPILLMHKILFPLRISELHSFKYQSENLNVKLRESKRNLIPQPQSWELSFSFHSYLLLIYGHPPPELLPPKVLGKGVSWRGIQLQTFPMCLSELGTLLYGP